MSADSWDVVSWDVVVGRAVNPGDPEDGAAEEVIASAPEDEARRVYADTVAGAAAEKYAYVKLRAGSREVESWPQATGWTS